MKVFLDALSRKPTVSIGTQALIVSSMQIIKRKYPSAQFIMLSANLEVERSYLDQYEYQVELVKRSVSQFGTMKQVRRVLDKVDVVVSPWGDGYITFPPHQILQKTIFLKKKGVPLVLFTSSIGPFQGKIKKQLAKFGLALFDELTIRDKITYDFIKELGTDNVNMVPDTAFVLNPSSDEVVDRIFKKEKVPVNKSFIGLNISILLLHRYGTLHNKDYVNEMVLLIKELKKNYKLPVVLIPHQVFPDCYQATQAIRESEGGDDRVALEKVMDALQKEPNVYGIKGIYSPSDMKGIISRSEIFIGGRMHSVIGALSSCVPAVILQYSHKASGVMNSLGLGGYVWDIGDSTEQLYQVVDNLWRKKDEYRLMLRNNIASIQAETYGAADSIERAFKRIGK